MVGDRWQVVGGRSLHRTKHIRRATLVGFDVLLDVVDWRRVVLVVAVTSSSAVVVVVVVVVVLVVVIVVVERFKRLLFTR